MDPQQRLLRWKCRGKRVASTSITLWGSQTGVFAGTHGS